MSSDPNSPGSALLHYLDDNGNIVCSIRIPEIVVQYHNVPYPVEFCYNIRDLTYEPLEENRKFINDYLSSILVEFAEYKIKAQSKNNILPDFQKNLEDINSYTEKIQNFIKEINEFTEIPSHNETLIESLLVRNLSQVLFILMRKFFKDLYEILPSFLHEEMQKEDHYFTMEKNEISILNAQIQNLSTYQALFSDPLLNNKDLLIMPSFTDVIRLSKQLKEIMKMESEFFEKKEKMYKNEEEYKFILEFSENLQNLNENYSKEYEKFIQDCKSAIKKLRKRESLAKVHHIQFYDWAYLSSYDIESKSLQSGPILSAIFKNMTEYSFIAEIPGKLFVLAHEKINDISSGFMCTLDADTKEAKLLCKGSYNFNLIGIYYKKSIYMFGGSTEENTSQKSMKYDLSTNTIEFLQDLPSPAEFCSCLIFDEKILIAGYQHTNIYEYDPKYDSYLVPSQKFYYGNKALTTDYKRVYLFESNRGIWQSEECYLEGWAYISSNSVKWDHFTWRYDQNEILIFTSDFKSRIANESSPDFRSFKFNLKKKEISFGLI